MQSTVTCVRKTTLPNMQVAIVMIEISVVLKIKQTTKQSAERKQNGSH